MVLGSMGEFVELVKKAKDRGYYTVVCDGYADGPAKRYADKALNVDVRNVEEITRLCKECRVDGIVTSFSDLLAECLVNIADMAGLPCYAQPDKFRYLREKPLMKEMLYSLGVNAPNSVCVHRESLESDIGKIGFPCVTKPVNGYGSRGIYVLDSASQVEAHFDEIVSYSSFDYILAEEYNQGHEFNMMNWIVNGEVVTLGLADREKSKEIAFAIPHVSRCAYPSRMIDLVYEEARGIVKKVADYVGIKNGPLSMQFFYSADEGIQVCEVAGRLFGYEHELVTLSSGLSIEDLLLDYAYDQDALRHRLDGHSPFSGKYSAGLYFHGFEGRVSSISSVEKLRNLDGVSSVLPYYREGEMIEHGVGAKPYVVRCYLTASSRDSLDILTERIYDEISVLDENGNNLLFSNQMTPY